MEWLIAAIGLVVAISAGLGAMGYRGRQQVVGIDLGTTFSVVAVKQGQEVTILPDWYSGKPLLPSVVTYHPDGTTIVGSRAVKLRGELPLHTVFNAKRFIGRPQSEVLQDAAGHPFRAVADPRDHSEDSLSGFAIPAKSGEPDRWVSPIAVGAAVIRHMGVSISKHMGYDMNKAVICVPAKFSWRERKATTDAYAAAGFKVMRVLEEPTAAAIAYNLHKASGTRYVLVYDIGGGTLDTSLLFMNGKAVSVLGVAGDDHLGGSDFDLRVRDLLLRKLPEAPSLPQEGAEAPEQACGMAGLLMLGEEAKIALSDAAQVEVRCRGEDGGIRRLTVTRQEFEEVSQDLFDRSMEPVVQVLKDQMMIADDVDDVVLVGGSSRLPKLRELLQEFVGPENRLHTEIDPDVTVAYGAANILD